MKKIASSRLFLIIVMALLLIPSLLLTFFMAYIMLAPDDLPKPFYLSYQYPDSSLQHSNQEAVSESNNGHGESSSAASNSTGDHGETGTSYEPPTSIAPAALLEIRPGQGLMIDTGSKIVNLADPTGRRYIRVNIVLEFSPTQLEYYSMGHEEQSGYVAAFNEDINSKMPVINDIMISLLSGKTFEDVYSAEGKEYVRQEIMHQLNTKLPEYRVIFVYFTEFVVQ